MGESPLDFHDDTVDGRNPAGYFERKTHLPEIMNLSEKRIPLRQPTSCAG